MERLRRANPVAADDVDHLVAADRRALIDALEAEPASLAAADASTRAGRARRVRRPTMALAGALAAVVVLAVAVVAVGDRVTGNNGVETAIADSCFRVVLDDESATTPTNGVGFNRSADLLSLHFDFAHLDDGHAAVAAREVATRLELAPVVVAGTQTGSATSFVHEYETMMEAAWDDQWSDATADRDGARSESLGRWLSTLDAGGQVWVAEGGVSDFTAEVVREIATQRPDLDTAALIHVVQHSERNESETWAEDLAFVVANTEYKRIDDGNARNGTANFNGPSPKFEEAALGECHRKRWSAAFEYLSAAELDFSDTVTLLHILDIDVTTVGNADEFAAMFLTDPASAK